MITNCIKSKLLILDMLCIRLKGNCFFLPKDAVFHAQRMGSIKDSCKIPSILSLSN